MKDDLKKLYSAIIKEHSATPFHFEKPGKVKNTVKAYNPICGDRFEVYIGSDERMVNALYFHGSSTSILVKTLEGKSRKEALELCDQFLRFINKELGSKEQMLSDDFLAFAGVHDFPERYDCVLLSWREMKRFLESSAVATKSQRH